MPFKLTKLLSETNLDILHVQMWKIYMLEVQHEISKSYLAMQFFFLFSFWVSLSSSDYNSLLGRM